MSSRPEPTVKPKRRPVHRSPFRAYRAEQQPELTVFQLAIEETDLWVAARTDLAAPMANHVRLLRGQIKTYAALHPEFLPALTPLDPDPCAPDIIRRMCRASLLTGVGPMAAVAGTVAQMVAEEFGALSPDLLVENGGDTYLLSTRERHIGILAIPDQDLRLGVTVPAGEFPCSFCASSARIGHSLSFGNADLVVVRARDAALADAAATALANMLTDESHISQVLDQARTWEGIGLDGVFAQCAGRIGVWGKMELTVL